MDIYKSHQEGKQHIYKVVLLLNFLNIVNPLHSAIHLPQNVWRETFNLRNELLELSKYK